MQKRKHDWTAEARPYKDAEAFPWSLCFYTDAAFRCRALSRQFAPWPYLRRSTWALYCEQMMLDEGLHTNDPKYRLAQLQLALQRACRYLAAIRMHTAGMTVEQAARFFEQNAYMTPHNAMVEALRGTQDPGYLRYELGKLMILRLREEVRKKEGAAFDLGRFHDAFLEQGGLPLKLIRRAMLGADGPLL